MTLSNYTGRFKCFLLLVRSGKLWGTKEHAAPCNSRESVTRSRVPFPVMQHENACSFVFVLVMLSRLKIVFVNSNAVNLEAVFFCLRQCFLPIGN